MGTQGRAVAAIVMAAFFFWTAYHASFAAVPGDLNGNNKIDLTDLVSSLQIIASRHSPFAAGKDADMDGDGRIGSQESVYILQCLAGVRSCDKKPPEILSTTPAATAAGVPTSIIITASFDEIIDAASVTTATFTVLNSSNQPIAGTVHPLGKTIQFVPQADLAVGAYTAGITTGIKDLAGNALAADYCWPFTTADGIASGILAFAPGPADLMVKNGYLFFSNTSQWPLVKMPITGEQVYPLAERTGVPENMIIRGQHIFWVDRGGASSSGCIGDNVHAALKMTSLDGMNTTVLAQGDNCNGATADIIVDDTDVYWATSSTTPDTYRIVKVPRDGKAPTVLADTINRIRGLADDAANIYWTEDRWPNPEGGGSLVRKIPKSGGDATVLASQLKAITGGLIRYGSELFFADANGVDTYRLMKMSTAGGPLIVLAEVVSQDLFNDRGNYLKSMTITGDRVFWLDKTRLRSVAVAGGAIADLVRGIDLPAHVAVTGDHVIWTETACCSVRANGSIKKISITGGTVSTVMEGLDNPGVIMADASRIYWIEGGPYAGIEGYGRIAMMPAAGGPAASIIVSVGDGPFTVDDTHVYLANRWTINKVPINGGLPERVHHALENIVHMATDGTHVYWIDAGANVFKVPTEGGAPTILNTLFTGGPAGPIAVAHGFVYWMTRYDTIKKVSTAGGDEVTIAAGLPFLSDFVVDDAFIYFSEHDTGNVKKVSVGGGPVLTLAEAVQPYPSYRNLALDGLNLYWIDQSNIAKIPLAGGTVSFLMAGGFVADPFVPAHIAVDAASLYWTEPPVGFIHKITPK